MRMIKCSLLTTTARAARIEIRTRLKHEAPDTKHHSAVALSRVLGVFKEMSVGDGAGASIRLRFKLLRSYEQYV